MILQIFLVLCILGVKCMIQSFPSTEKFGVLDQGFWDFFTKSSQEQLLSLPSQQQQLAYLTLHCSPSDRFPSNKPKHQPVPCLNPRNLPSPP